MKLRTTFLLGIALSLQLHAAELDSVLSELETSISKHSEIPKEKEIKADWNIKTESYHKGDLGERIRTLTADIERYEQRLNQATGVIADRVSNLQQRSSGVHLVRVHVHNELGTVLQRVSLKVDARPSIDYTRENAFIKDDAWLVFQAPLPAGKHHFELSGVIIPTIDRSLDDLYDQVVLEKSLEVDVGNGENPMHTINFIFKSGEKPTLALVSASNEKG